MTSIISPALYAMQLATKAQASLADANEQLTLPTPRPLPFPQDGLVRIPEMNGPDSPDNPWFVRPNPELPVRTPFHLAASHATTAIQAIDSALALGANDSLSRDVLAAFGRAKEQATAGVRQLTSKTTRPIDPQDVVLQFNAGSAWLNVAKSLLQLDGGRVRPPVTTLPVDPMLPTEPTPEGPHPLEPQQPLPGTPLYPTNPDGPVAVEPITIQLPSPDSPIQ